MKDIRKYITISLSTSIGTIVLWTLKQIWEVFTTQLKLNNVSVFNVFIFYARYLNYFQQPGIFILYKVSFVVFLNR